MRTYIVVVPFISLLASAIALLFVGDEAGVSVLFGRIFIGAIILCLLFVPLISKRSLKLGYAALLLPFGTFAILSFLTTKPEATVTVTEKSEFKWDKDPKIDIDEFVKAIEAHKKKPNQQLEPTPIVVTPAADASVAPTTGAAHH
jgi:hypothetical protein